MHLLTNNVVSVVKPSQVVNITDKPPEQQQKNPDPTTEKWAGTLRRRETLLPAIGRKASLGSGRMQVTRSVERLSKTGKTRPLIPIKPRLRRKDMPNEGADVTIFEKDEKVFDATGYELHLVETLERDILQRNPDVRWKDVIGLDDAKSVLQEAMVLPLVMPDYFKVRCILYHTSCTL